MKNLLTPQTVLTGQLEKSQLDEQILSGRNRIGALLTKRLKDKATPDA